MAHDADYLIDRRRLKRSLFVWRAVAIAAIVAVVAVWADRLNGFYDGDYVARLSINGIIFDDPWRHEALAKLKKDTRAKALIVQIDSPGGTVVGGEVLHRQLRDIASDRPVVAVMGQVATSAGYMVAIGADRIYARDGTITGSIGVILQTTEVTGLLDKLGIKTEAIKSGPLKAAPSPFEPMTDEVRRATQRVVADIYALFVDLVAERRAIDRETVLALADGRVVTGRRALADRLVDAIGGETEAIEWLAKERAISPDLPVRDVGRDDELARWLENVSSLARKVVFSERLSLDGLISVWHPSIR
jgi:protease-4